MEGSIRIRVCLAVVENARILLVPHYETDAGAVQWLLPGGRLEFGEGLQAAAAREFFEETGMHAEVTGLLDVSEVILPDRPYHSISISFSGRITGGKSTAEANHPYGAKMPRWFSRAELAVEKVHPAQTVEEAFLRCESR